MSEILVNSLKTAAGVDTLTFDSTGDVLLSTGRIGRVAGNTITIDSDGILNAASVNVSSAITLPAGSIDSSAIGTGAVKADKLDVGQIGGRRNLIINGAMQVAQRGTSFTSAASGTWGADRFKYEASTSAVVNVEQSTDAPPGFINSIKVTTTTADGSIGTNDFQQFLYKLEGQDIAQLQYGTSGAKPVMFSFWAKSSETGTFPISFQNHNGSRVYPENFTINSADTWEYKTIVVSGDTGGTWTTTGNSVGLRFTLMWSMGSNFTEGVKGAWAATTSYADLTTTYTANMDQVNSYLQITGVQLEVGTVATPFEHRSYGEELALCQRYFFKSYNDGVTPGTATSEGSYYRTVDAVTPYASPGPIRYAVTMRANPTITFYAPGTGTSGKITLSGDKTPVLTSNGANGCGMYVSNNSSGVGIGSSVHCHITAEAEL